MKCSSESRSRCRACLSTAAKKASAMSPASRRCRFLLNTVTSQIGIIHVQPYEPAEQQVVVQLFHQHPFAAHRVQHLKQSARNNFSGAIEGRPVLAYSLLKRGCQIAQCLIGHDPDRPKRMVVRDSLLGTYVAENSQLLIVLSTHAFFLSACTVDRGVVFQHPAKVELGHYRKL